MRQDTIAARGLVRTFQLVQLFQNMTVPRTSRSAATCDPGRRRRGAAAASWFAARKPRATAARANCSLSSVCRPGRHASRAAALRPAAPARSRARAWPPSPRLLLLDEPAAGLNRARDRAARRHHPELDAARHHRAADRTRHGAGDAHRAIASRCSISAARSPKERRTKSGATRTSSPPISAPRRRCMPDAAYLAQSLVNGARRRAASTV